MKQEHKYSGPGGSHVGMWGRTIMFRAPVKDPKAPGGDDPPDDDLPKTRDEWAKFIGEITHATFAEREKRSEKSRTKAMTDSITAAMGEFAKSYGLKPPGEEPEVDPANPDPKAKPGKVSALPPEMQAEIAKSRKDAATALEKANAAEAREKAAQAKADAQEERGMLITALQGKVRPEVLDDIIDAHHSKRVKRDPDTRSILWKNGPKDEDVIPFEDGVKSWLESAAGKSVAPPIVAGGGGTGRSNGAGNIGGGKDHVATDAEVGAFINRPAR